MDTLAAGRALTQLEAVGLLQRSEQRRGDDDGGDGAVGNVYKNCLNAKPVL